jgi:hypothetical protein
MDNVTSSIFGYILPHIDVTTVLMAIFGVLFHISEKLPNSAKYAPNSIWDFVITFWRGGITAVKNKLGNPPFLVNQAISAMDPKLDALVEKILNKRTAACSLDAPTPLTVDGGPLIHSLKDLGVEVHIGGDDPSLELANPPSPPTPNTMGRADAGGQ